MIIILEGMSTAGKTMVQKELAKILQEQNIKHRIVDQNEGLPPETFAHLDPKKSFEFLTQFIQESSRDEVVVCDRLHLSHAAITNWPDDNFIKIEKELQKFNPLLVMLVIQEEKIKDRIEGAVKHRGDQWIREMDRHGRIKNSHIEWFTGTQNRILSLYNKSTLPKVEFDTTDLNFIRIAKQIFNTYIDCK